MKKNQIKLPKKTIKLTNKQRTLLTKIELQLKLLKINLNAVQMKALNDAYDAFKQAMLC